MRLSELSPSAFENLSYDVLVDLGLENAVWRTPGSDGGRDIEGQFGSTDLSGYRYTQTWYVECKKYASSVDWPTVHEKIAYADAHSADFLLIITTSSLSPQAVDKVNLWNGDKGRRPRIRFWNGHELERILTNRPLIAAKYNLTADSQCGQNAPMLALSFITLKFTHAAYSTAVFADQEASSLEPAAALADLVLHRMELYNRRLRWYPEELRNEDLYEWLVVDQFSNLVGYDRFGFRAFFSVLRSMLNTRTLLLSTSVQEITTVLGNPLSSTQRGDLTQIALSSDFELLVGDDMLRITKRN